jgi:DNA-binding transcriptional MocR family regulator
VERPTYFLLQPIVDQNHLVTVGVPTDGRGVDVDALEQLLSEARVR